MKEAFPDNRFLSTVCSALPSFLPDTRHRISVPSSRSDPRLPAGFCFPQHSSTNRTCCCSSCYTQNHPEHQSENHPPPVVRAVRPPWGEIFPEFINHLVCHHKLERSTTIECCATVDRRNVFLPFFSSLTLDTTSRWRSGFTLQRITSCIAQPFLL